jgi:hypothetical protein
MSQLTQSSALIGQNVTYIDPATNESRTGTVSKVKIIEGVATLEIGGQDVPLGNVTEILGPAQDSGGTDSGSGDSGQGGGDSGSGS